MFPHYKLQPQRQRKRCRFERILNNNFPFHINPATKIRRNSIDAYRTHYLIHYCVRFMKRFKSSSIWNVDYDL